MSHRESLSRIIRSELGDDVLSGAEIGVNRGANSLHLLKEFSQLTLYMIDSWAVARRDSPWIKTGDPCAMVTGKSQDERFRESTRVTLPYANRRQVIRGVSWEVADQLPPLDFAFLDGDHSREGVTKDLSAYWPLVKIGGFISGHDYQSSGRIPHIRGVKWAVDQFASAHDVEITVTESSVWWIGKTE